jgi:membrane protein required for colicin V production
MNALDWAIVGVTAISVLLGVWRGFVREVLSLAGWIVGIWLAIRFAPALGRGLPAEVALVEVRIAVAAVAIVVGALVVAAILAWLIGKLMSAVRLSGTDRLLGAVFGLLRAALILLLLVLFAGRTALASQPLWRESQLLPHVEAAVRLAAPLLPPALGGRDRT